MKLGRKYDISSGFFSCICCGGNKPLSDFYKRGERIHFKCKKCLSINASNYYKNNRVRLDGKNKLWAIDNPDRAKKIKLTWLLNNTEKRKEVSKKYRIKNKEKERVRQHERYHRDIKYRLSNIISVLIRFRLKKRLLQKNCRSTFSFLPYTVDELILHLEKQFKPGMNWDNYGQWHIDHVVPDSSFDYRSVDDENFKICWSLNNLQPLWAIDNIKKSNKIL